MAPAACGPPQAPVSGVFGLRDSIRGQCPDDDGGRKEAADGCAFCFWLPAAFHLNVSRAPGAGSHAQATPRSRASQISQTRAYRGRCNCDGTCGMPRRAALLPWSPLLLLSSCLMCAVHAGSPRLRACLEPQRQPPAEPAAGNLRGAACALYPLAAGGAPEAPVVWWRKCRRSHP